MKKIFTIISLLSTVLITSTSCKESNSRSTMVENSSPKSSKEFTLSVEPKYPEKNYNIMQYLLKHYFAHTDIKLLIRDEKIAISWSSTKFNDVATLIVYGRVFNSLAEIMEKYSVYLFDQNDTNESDIYPLNAEIIKVVIDYHSNHSKDEKLDEVKEHIIYESPLPSNVKYQQEKNSLKITVTVIDSENYHALDPENYTVVFAFEFKSKKIFESFYPYPYHPAYARMPSKKYLQTLNEEAKSENLMMIFCELFDTCSFSHMRARRVSIEIIN